MAEAKRDPELKIGHLLAATYKVKYAEQGKTGIEGVVDAAQDRPAMPLKVDKPPGNNKDAAAAAKEAERRRHRSLAYPIVEFDEVWAGGFVRLRNPWAKVGESEAPVYKGRLGAQRRVVAKRPRRRAGARRPAARQFVLDDVDRLRRLQQVLRVLPAARAVQHDRDGGGRVEKTGGGHSAAPGAKWRSKGRSIGWWSRRGAPS